ncbi:hypothetical protein C3O94_15220, partial [Clostridioides difficile]|nr:hypothetical protein [Clostridioides difficile]MCZ1086938.1 hypothetical protein [Clostridioides difficile]
VISTYNENGDTLVPDATVKDNNVIVRSTENNRTFVYLINGNAETHFINATVDDNRVSEMTTYSSKKIKEEMNKIAEQLTGEVTRGVNVANSIINKL